MRYDFAFQVLTEITHRLQCVDNLLLRVHESPEISRIFFEPLVMLSLCDPRALGGRAEAGSFSVGGQESGLPESTTEAEATIQEGVDSFGPLISRVCDFRR
jgi:hypothetical protein